MTVAAAHMLPNLDWLVELGIGLVTAAAGVLLFRQAPRGGLAFALALFIAQTGTLLAIRAVIAAGASSRWQYVMPFALVIVPALFVSFILTRMGRWRSSGFTPPRDWRSLHLAIPLAATLALPAIGLTGRGVMSMLALVFALQVVFMLINVFMEEATYRGIVLDALGNYPVVERVVITSALFGLSHIDNFFLPGADEIGVLYQMFEAMLIGILFTATRLRMNSIWPVMAAHAAYNFMLILAFGHAYPVAPTLPGFMVATSVNLALAGLGFYMLRPLVLPAELRKAA